MTDFVADVRHRCRNPRCRSKLPAPVENPRNAFCVRGCFTSFYRHRCLVCEQEFARRRDDQHICNRRKCKSAFRRNRERFFAKWYQGPATVKLATQTPTKPGTFWRDKQGRGWCWERLPGDDDDWRLVDREDREVARVRQEGKQYWVGYPRCHPEPPLESLDEAKRRAVTMALWTLPAALPKQPKPTRPCANIQLETFRHTDWSPTNGGGDCWEIPDFLLRR